MVKKTKPTKRDCTITDIIIVERLVLNGRDKQDLKQYQNTLETMSQKKLYEKKLNFPRSFVDKKTNQIMNH